MFIPMELYQLISVNVIIARNWSIALSIVLFIYNVKRMTQNLSYVLQETLWVYRAFICVHSNLVVYILMFVV
jgi:hypothetical protein